METEEKVETKKKRKWGWIFLCYGIWASVTNNGHNSFGESHLFTMLLFLVGIVSAPFLYYRFRDKFKIFHFIKNEGVRNFVIGLGFMIVFVFLITFLGALGDNWKAIAVRTPFGTEIATQDRDSLAQLNQNQKTYLADFQTRWDKAQENIDDNTDSKIGYMNNVTGYKAVQKLNDERQDEVVQYFNQVSPVLAKYSQRLVDALSQIVKSDEKARDVYNELFVAKINYFQTLIDNRPEAEVSAKAEIIHNAFVKVAPVVQEGAQDQQNYQKVYEEFFGS